MIIQPKTLPTSFAVIVTCLTVLAGFGCNKETTTSVSDGGADTNTGADTDSDTDSDTDADADGDTDTDTDTDSDSDSGTGTSESADWEWVANPKEDCGQNCTRISITDRIDSEWDVWENFVVYRDAYEPVHVCNFEKQLTMKMPDIFEEHSTDEKGDAGVYAPTIFENGVYYTLVLYSPKPEERYVIYADINNKTQEIVWEKKESGNDDMRDETPRYMDSFGFRLVSEGGVGDPDKPTLSVFEKPWPTEGEVLIDDYYGGYNSLWEDILIFWSLPAHPSLGHENIKGYDFAKKEFFFVTEDDEFQFAPRIHKKRVVYMDFRLGESASIGNWEHAAIFMKDLDSGEVKQITSGEWIAAYPDIHDDIIVWQDNRNCSDPNNKNDWSGTEIWGYNLKTDKEFQITDIPGRPKTSPRIWGDKVFVDMATETAGSAIYMFNLPDGAR